MATQNESNDDPFRGDRGEDVVYRRSSALARWSVAFAGAGILVLGGALVFAIRRFPWDAEAQWILLGLVLLAVPLLLVPEYARERMVHDARFVDPGHDIARAEKVTAAGATVLGVVLVVCVVAPFAFLAFWVLMILLGVWNWPFG